MHIIVCTFSTGGPNYVIDNIQSSSLRTNTAGRYKVLPYVPQKTLQEVYISMKEKPWQKLITSTAALITLLGPISGVVNVCF